MAKFLLTGGATGIGAATRSALVADGHTVITLDIKGGDYEVDLGDPESRHRTLQAVKQDHSQLDGLVTCAGVASHFPDKEKILSINYWGTVEIIEGLKDILAPDARIVAISSNSAPQCTRPELVDAMLNNDLDSAMRLARDASGHDCYSGSKQAVARWVRRAAPEYARDGIGINAIAPGYIETPMTQAVAESPGYGDAIRQFVESIPAGRPGTPDDVAGLIVFLLSASADFIAGSLIFIDGAHDAMFRPQLQP